MIDLAFVTIHPDLIQAYSQFGVFRAAQKKSLAKLSTIQLRDFAVDKHGSIDDRPYGGGDSMIMRPEPLRDAVTSCGEERHVIFTAPGAQAFTHQDALDLARLPKTLVFVCGRFGGVDQRFIDRYVDQTFSFGSFVMSGGELPCLMIADAVLRQVPGVLGNQLSSEMDSFASGTDGQVESPQYTRPEVFEGTPVPSPLLSGNHQEIARWRRSMQRPDPRKP